MSAQDSRPQDINPEVSWQHHHADVNGICIHYVAAGEGQPIILCHGFPHTWYSWHHQIGALSQAGYRVIAPDMRGMGETSAPSAVEAYSVAEITSDLLGLLDYLGLEKAVWAGLDFGVFAIYDLAMRHPERVTALIGLENPAAPHNPEVPPLTEYAQMGRHSFLHIEYFRPVGPADRDLAAAPREFIQKVFYALSGAYDFAKVMSKPPDYTYLQALPEPPPLPWSWFTENDLDVLATAYEKSGFTGGLNWYRSMDIKWRERKPFEGRQSPVPAYFLGSEHDVDLAHFHGDDPISLMRRQFPNLLDVRMVPGAGHLLPMEKPEATNAILLDYLDQIHATR